MKLTSLFLIVSLFLLASVASAQPVEPVIRPGAIDRINAGMRMGGLAAVRGAYVYPPVGGYYGGQGYYGGGYGGYGYGFAPRNTGVMGAAVNNKLQVIIWNALPEKVEVFWNNDRVQVEPGDRKTKNINGGNPWAVFLGASNYFPEDWLTEKMVGVRVVGNKGEPTFKKVTSIVPNWNSYSRRSITLVVRKDQDGGLTIKSVNEE